MWRPNYFYRGYALHGSNSGADLRGQPWLRPPDGAGDEPHWSQLYIGEPVNVDR
jgi:hypothetical protein